MLNPQEPLRQDFLVDENETLESWFKRHRSRKNKFPRRPGVVLAAAVVTIVLFLFPAIRGMERDWYYAWARFSRPAAAIAPVSLILEVGDVTAQELGVWPWPRDYLAPLIEALNDAGAAAIVVDDSLRMSGVSPEADDLLEKTLMQNGKKVYFSASPERQDPPPRFLVQARGLVQLETLQHDEGVAESWVFAWAPIGGKTRIYAAAQVLKDYFGEVYQKLENRLQGGTLLIPWDKKELDRLNRFEYSDWIRAIEKSETERTDIAGSMMPFGKIIWVGSAMSRFEVAPWRETISRVRLGAMLFEQMRAGRAEKKAPAWSVFLTFIFLTAALVFLSRYRGMLFWIGYGILAVAVLFLSWAGLFFFQFYAAPISALLLIGLSALGLLIEELLRSESEKKLFFHLASRDGLTNLYGIRHFRLMMNQLVLESIAKREKIALILVDLDHFKIINDSFGHEAGDDALRGTAEAIASVVRQKRNLEEVDFVARYGGEEFMVLIRRCDLEVTAMIAERIRHAVESMALRRGNKRIVVTASLGVAVLNPGESIPDPMVHRADQALYLAKKEGRNCVRTQSDLPK